jgi:hypothetical protein
MSNTPMNLNSGAFFPCAAWGSPAMDALIFITSQLNKRSYSVLASVSRASVAWNQRTNTLSLSKREREREQQLLQFSE